MSLSDLPAVALSEAQCRSLLVSKQDGVVAVSMRALPMAFPIHYALLDGEVIVRTAKAGPLFGQIDGHIVTLTAYDRPPTIAASSWWVAATGRAHAVGEGVLLEACRRLPLQPCSATDAFVRIPLDLVVGHASARLV
jgi:hypothetical protein